MPSEELQGRITNISYDPSTEIEPFDELIASQPAMIQNIEFTASGTDMPGSLVNRDMITSPYETVGSLGLFDTGGTLAVNQSNMVDISTNVIPRGVLKFNGDEVLTWDDGEFTWTSSKPLRKKFTEIKKEGYKDA